MPRGQVVSPRRRGYAGNHATRQAFFLKFFRGEAAQQKADLPLSSSRYILSVSRYLIVRKIIRAKLRRRSKYLVALDDSAAVSARSGFIFTRIRRDDSGAARGQTINQPSIGRDSKHSDAHRTLARRRCRSDTFLFAARARLTRSDRLCCLGLFRGCRSSLVLSGTFRNRVRRSGRDSSRRRSVLRLRARCLSLLNIRRWGLRRIRNCRAVRRGSVR
jgi:hypothetical protein